jgi:hypothetical protein
MVVIILCAPDISSITRIWKLMGKLRYILVALVVGIGLYVWLRYNIDLFYFYPGGNVPRFSKYTTLKIDNHISIVDKQKLASNNAMLIAHGNGGTIYDRDKLIGDIHQGYKGDIYCFEYPGFPGYPGTFHVSDVIKECNWWADYLCGHYKSVDLLGESIGGGVVVQTFNQFKQKEKIGALYLLSSFTSLRNVLNSKHWTLSLLHSLVAGNDFNTADFLKEFGDEGPKIVVIHSEEDDLIPYSHAQENFEIIKTKNKQMFTTTGGHNSTKLKAEFFK